jgi:hypothetical protein
MGVGLFVYACKLEFTLEHTFEQCAIKYCEPYSTHPHIKINKQGKAHHNMQRHLLYMQASLFPLTQHPIFTTKTLIFLTHGPHVTPVHT